jgi:hypothetical protein
MPKKRWTSAEQFSWLEERIPAFIQAQQAKITSTFLEDTHQKWQDKWPIEAPTDDELRSARGDVERALAVKHKALEDVSCLKNKTEQRHADFSLPAREVLVSQSHTRLIVRHWHKRGLETVKRSKAHAPLASISE